MEIILFQSHQEGNLKVRLLIASGYYNIPNPSTALIFTLIVIVRPIPIKIPQEAKFLNNLRHQQKYQGKGPE